MNLIVHGALPPYRRDEPNASLKVYAIIQMLPGQTNPGVSRRRQEDPANQRGEGPLLLWFFWAFRLLEPGKDVSFGGHFAHHLDLAINDNGRRRKDAKAGDLLEIRNFFHCGVNSGFLDRLQDYFFCFLAFGASWTKNFDFHNIPPVLSIYDERSCLDDGVKKIPHQQNAQPDYSSENKDQSGFEHLSQDDHLRQR